MIVNGTRIRVFDNGGESFDRYTVFINGSYFGMSHTALSPCGFNQYCGEVEKIPKPYTHLGREIRKFESLPKDVQTAIFDRMLSGLIDEAVVTVDQDHVARTLEAKLRELKIRREMKIAL